MFLTVSFSFKSNVQVLKFSDQLSNEESTKVLAKLEEKMKQGRKLYLFHLEHFQNQDDTAKSKIVHLIKFCFQQNLNLALCLPQKSWSIYSSGSLALAKMFNTEAEGLLYLETISARTDATLLSFDEVKIKETDELVRKYEIFHKPDVLDPYHLKNMSQIYSLTPTVEAIENLEKATIDISKRRESIVRLELQCEKMSQQALEMTISRNKALKETEFALRQKQIQALEDVQLSHQKILYEKISELRRELEMVNAALSNTPVKL